MTDKRLAPVDIPAPSSAPLPTPPMLVIPATALGCQATTTFDGRPAVMLQMSNPIAHTNFPMDLEQARNFADQIQQAILEAQGLEVQSRKLIRR